MARHFKSGEAGILGRPFLQVLTARPHAAYPYVTSGVVISALVVVGCCCLSLFGIGVSTLLAHYVFEAGDATWLAAATVIPVSHRSLRQRKAGAVEPSQARTGIAASYSRFSSSLQSEDSLEGQQRLCREAALKNGHEIPRELEFSDEAISGARQDRAALNNMLEAASEGQFGVLYVHSLSRLSRDLTFSIKLLRQLVNVHKIRFVSISEGVDSEVTGWDMISTMLSMLHERFLSELKSNVRRGHELTLHSGFSLGDHCFGYRTEPIPEQADGRRGRNSKPRMHYLIDEAEAKWVRQIFEWYVEDNRSIRWIVKRLNAEKAPKDHRSSTPNWHHALVTGLLAREKYIGVWPWGDKKNVRDPETGKITQEQRSVEESSQWTREFPELQIIDNDTFRRAQDRLAANYEKWGGSRQSNGKFNGSTETSNGRKSRRIFSGLLRCHCCGAPLVSSGIRTQCRNAKVGMCAMTTSVKTALLEKLLLAEIGSRIRSDEAWFQQVLAESILAYRNRIAGVPDAIATKKRELAEIEQRISRLLDLTESGNAPRDVTDRLTQRQKERAAVELALRNLERNARPSTEEPTAVWVREKLDCLWEVFQHPCPTANEAMAVLIADGCISMEEVESPGRKRKHLQARFRLSVRAVESYSQGFAPDESPSQAGDEIVIDFLEPSPGDDRREEAWKLYHEGRLIIEIAQALKLSKSRTHAILKEAFELRGETMPNGFKRKKSLQKQFVRPPVYQEISDEVMELYHRMLELGEIAEQLNLDRNTITKAIRHWHESRGLPVPDGRTRRIQLREHRNQQSPQQDRSGSD